MDIQLVDVNKNDKIYSEIVKLYKQTFVHVERTPFWFMNLRIKQNRLFLKAIYSNNKFIGFIYYAIVNDIVFILYFAIDKTFQSNGFGRKVLAYIKNENKDRKIFLEVEELNIKANDYTNRARRVMFYERNGFYCSDNKIQILKQKYDILSYNGKITDYELENTYKAFFGVFKIFFKPKII